MCCDHRGYKLKNKLKNELTELGFVVEDINPEFNENDDYPLITKKACQKVLENNLNFGIFVCGTGTGMNIVANKTKGIRATETNKIKTVELSRAKNNCNVLCLGADHIFSLKAKILVLKFLTTKFSNEERHIKRISQME